MVRNKDYFESGPVGRLGFIVVCGIKIAMREEPATDRRIVAVARQWVDV